jgi:hypothetical protein
LVVQVSERLPPIVTHAEAVRDFVDVPWRREAAGVIGHGRDLESQSFVRRSVGDFRAVMHFGCPSILHQANAWLLLMGHPLDNSRSSA